MVNPSLGVLDNPIATPSMATLQIDGGKRRKIRSGDILGALTGANGIAGSQVGKINIFTHWAYVAVTRDAAGVALNRLNEGKLKGRTTRARQGRQIFN